MLSPSIFAPRVRVLVIGGIGSGKSTVAGVFGDLGAVVIEADAVGHEILEPSGGAYDDVAAHWPQVVTAGHIDRSALAAIVFSDVAHLRVLESITHPRIRDVILARVAAVAPDPVVVELPLATGMFDETWVRVVVEADEAIRIDRVVGRGSDEEDVRARIAAQPDREEWLATADYVIANNGTVRDLESDARHVWERILATVDR